MSSNHPLESLLRPAVELYTVWVCAGCVVLCIWAPWSLALAPSVGYTTAAGFAAFGIWRFRQAWVVLRYRRNMRRLPRFALPARKVPVSNRSLWLGKGFKWDAQHTQRLHESGQPGAKIYVQPNVWYQRARRLEQSLERGGLGQHIASLLRTDSFLNPVRPLPPVGGRPALHAVEWKEHDVWMPLGERVGHTLVEGTTRVGKTRLAEILITQDIRRGDITICFDPKGDADLMMRMYAEAQKAGRGDEFYIFHLGWPDVSCRYNAVGRFSRLSEVSTRVTGQLSGEGNSAAFRQFAWRFVNIVARARHALGERPSYNQILNDVVNIDALLMQYVQQMLEQQLPGSNQQITDIEGKITDKNTPRNLQGRHKRVVAIVQYLQQPEVIESLSDPVLDGLLSAVRYDKTYFDKIVASLLPLLEKLTSGKIAELLSPDYDDIEDDRPIIDWQQIFRKKGIVYVGLDALSDFEVAQAVGNSMFADIVSVAGHIYKFGSEDGLPGQGGSQKLPINLHCDEFNELMGDEFIPLINKGGGAGIQVTAYTQTLSDIEARIGSTAKAGQVVGNFNNLIMLRVREERTARLLTDQLAKVNVSTRLMVSMASDSADVQNDQDFSSSAGDRIGTESVEMLTPNDVINLPKGQAFALLEGGQLWKLRMPLPLSDKTEDVPKDVADIAQRMRSQYSTGEQWWQGVMPAPIHMDFSNPPNAHEQAIPADNNHAGDSGVEVNHGQG
ncbi:type IV conjugative transfer system coupling protein TraD [Kushneria indalinina]|uniref:Conjugative coupling factor TraD (TOL family) n=1 Tax=Kushneria indalinina DSM 14324 TaxID=1122140 RepID=A0A3D9DRP5_9GAMM|nr:type IV conjugative transfer system coupling protein TraD [Kushneria indalinina]REC93356.1 conjugative coupling factor TraD (TOL family) [Kushneria indalinina DSM 14324]